MKKVIFLMALAFGMMNFTTNTETKTVEKSIEVKNNDKNSVDTCTRTCRYAVNRTTGSRRLIGCTDWDCGSLPGFELTVSSGQ